MSIYEPLRDGFREFNKMLVDSQQWDVAHKQRANANARADRLLAGQLEERAFRREMARNADARAEEMQKAGIKYNADQLAFANKQFNFQKSQWLEGAGDRANKSLMLQFDADQIKHMSKPAPFNVSAMMGGDDFLTMNPEVQRRIGAELGVENASINENKQLVDGEGKIVPVTGMDLAALTANFKAIGAEFEDNPLKAKIKLQGIQKQIAGLDETITGLSGDVRWKPLVAKEKAKKARLQKVGRGVATQLTPENMIAYYEQKAKTSDNAAAMLDHLKQGSQAQNMMNVAAQSRKTARDLLMKQMGKGAVKDLQRVKLYDIKTGKFVGTGGWNASTNDIYLDSGKAIAGANLAKMGLTLDEPRAGRAPQNLTNVVRYTVDDAIQPGNILGMASSPEQHAAATKIKSDTNKWIMAHGGDKITADQRVQLANIEMAKAETKHNQFWQEYAIGTENKPSLLELSSGGWGKNKLREQYGYKNKQEVLDEIAKWKVDAIRELNYIPLDTYNSQILSVWNPDK